MSWGNVAADRRNGNSLEPWPSDWHLRVYTTSIDAEQGKVTVSGDVDPATLVKKLAKAGKHAELLAPKGGNNSCSNQAQKPQPQHGKGQQKDNAKPQKGSDDYDEEDDFDDDFDDDEMDELDCFDADFDDDFKNIKITPAAGAPNGNAVKGNNKGGGNGGGAKKGGEQNQGMCNNGVPKNGNGGGGKKGGGGSASKNGGGAAPQDGHIDGNDTKSPPNGHGNGQAGKSGTANGAKNGCGKNEMGGGGGHPMINPGMMGQGFPGMAMGPQMGNIPVAATAAQGYYAAATTALSINQTPTPVAPNSFHAIAPPRDVYSVNPRRGSSTGVHHRAAAAAAASCSSSLPSDEQSPTAWLLLRLLYRDVGVAGVSGSGQRLCDHGFTYVMNAACRPCEQNITRISKQETVKAIYSLLLCRKLLLFAAAGVVHGDHLQQVDIPHHILARYHQRRNAVPRRRGLAPSFPNPNAASQLIEETTDHIIRVRQHPGIQQHLGGVAEAPAMKEAVPISVSLHVDGFTLHGILTAALHRWRRGGQVQALDVVLQERAPLGLLRLPACSTRRLPPLVGVPVVLDGVLRASWKPPGDLHPPVPQL
ncbi:hypothetical protein B296_00042337 [Ensete ventricosum]|uniref:HMA domain-containing protein n=1 Tax=Ensete ventricosum TaxID=4639 RepID=A0A426X817_ENSVE|nr:hypothetical protein B296_00042337 [Ensete ventricosum]